VSSLAIDYSNPSAIRKAGIEVLTKELGPLGMVLFMRQYDSGNGNYTEERDELLKDITVEGLERELEAMNASKT
jgi:hypothetical protein